MLPVVELSSETPTQQLFNLPFETIATDWSGTASTSAPRFVLAVTPTRFVFVASCAGKPNCAHHPANTFVEGLWNQDVAELFLADTASQRYQEFNLSPTGAWWSHSFTAPRVRDQSFRKPEFVQCSAERVGEGWRACLSVPLTQLSIPAIASGNTRGNVCFILGSPEQRFYSFTKLGSSQPDYHRPGEFPALEYRRR